MGTATLAAEAGRQCARRRSVRPRHYRFRQLRVGPPHVLSHAGEIYTLYVSPEHHDRGVGRALLLSLFDALIDRGLNSAVVWVLAQNPARFFTKQWVADASLRRRSDCGTPCCRRRPMDGMTSAWSVLSATSAKRKGGLPSQRAAGGCMTRTCGAGMGLSELQDRRSHCAGIRPTGRYNDQHFSSWRLG